MVSNRSKQVVQSLEELLLSGIEFNISLAGYFTPAV